METDQYNDIAPYGAAEFRDHIKQMVKEPGFEHAIKYLMPEIDYDAFVSQLTAIDNSDDFQIKVMSPFLEMLARRTTDGLAMEGQDKLEPGKVYTFISNHRDIVLDAAFLNICLIREGVRTAEVALGDNLLIYEWIEHLVKVNKGFIVKRNLKLLEGFKAAQQLSGYIRYCLTQKHESVWIAQREGRAKDSNDVTQESVLKMLALSGGDNIVEALQQLNICPTTISYEYDPNDYLKAAEFLRRHRDPEFKKSSGDDLHAMEIGLIGYKGRVNFRLAECINDQLEQLKGITEKTELFPKVCQLLDSTIHRGYTIYPSNYISFDRVHGTSDFSECYTSEQVAEFDAYLNRQLDKVKVANVTGEEREFMRQMMLKMYSNPLRNKLIAEGKLTDNKK